MATKKVLVNLDYQGNQIINVRAEVAASAPANATEGRFYYNSGDKKLYVYTGTSWEVVGQDLPTGIVTADNDLTANKVLLGDGSKKAKASSFTIGTSVPANAVFTDETVIQDPIGVGSEEHPVLVGMAYTGSQQIGKSYVDPNYTYNPATGEITVRAVKALAGISVAGDTVATENYVNAQDAKINERISNISAFGRYLSGWDMATGKPASKPTTPTYTLVTGDYFIINNVPSAGATKYKPNQTGTWQVSQDFAKTATNEDCVVGGYWKYDGSSWEYFTPESAVSLPSFTNTTQGAIKGNQSPGCVYHDNTDPDGVGRVYGWDDKANDTNSHTISLTGDVTGSDSHTNESGSNASINVTISSSAVTSGKIADGAVTTAKIAADAVTQAKIKAKTVGIAIMNSTSSTNPYWQATSNANEYKATIADVTKYGSVALCEGNSNAFNGAKEVGCILEYASNGTDVTSCTAYINASAKPADNKYFFLCRKE